MEQIFIIQSIYHGKSEDLYESYPHKTLEGAKKHLAKLVEEFKDENKGREPDYIEVESCYAYLDYGDSFSNELTLNIFTEDLGD